ncbi:MAG: hypothetical protein ACLUFI_10485 [Oscillospiraceae bacterium]
MEQLSIPAGDGEIRNIIEHQSRFIGLVLPVTSRRRRRSRAARGRQEAGI